MALLQAVIGLPVLVKHIPFFIQTEQWVVSDMKTGTGARHR